LGEGVSHFGTFLGPLLSLSKLGTGSRAGICGLVQSNLISESLGDDGLFEICWIKTFTTDVRDTLLPCFIHDMINEAARGTPNKFCVGTINEDVEDLFHRLPRFQRLKCKEKQVGRDLRQDTESPLSPYTNTVLGRM
jgi:hypothetical protein